MTPGARTPRPGHTFLVTRDLASARWCPGVGSSVAGLVLGLAGGARASDHRLLVAGPRSAGRQLVCAGQLQLGWSGRRAQPGQVVFAQVNQPAPAEAAGPAGTEPPPPPANTHNMNSMNSAQRCV